MLTRRSGAPEFDARASHMSWLSADRRARPKPLSPAAFSAGSVYHQTMSPSVSRMNTVHGSALEPTDQKEPMKNPLSTWPGNSVETLMIGTALVGAPVVSVRSSLVCVAAAPFATM